MKAWGWSAFVVVSAALGVWRAYVLTVGWWWFVVPQFGVKALGVVPAFGLIAIVHLILPSRPDWDEESDLVRDFGRMVWLSGISPLLLLGCLWLAHRLGGAS